MARASRRLVICLDNSGYEVSLERRKIYIAILDAEAARHGRIHTGGSPPTALLTILNGRAIALTAAVTMTNTAINVPAPWAMLNE